MRLVDVQAGGCGAPGALARAGLAVLSLGYSAGVRLRGIAYDRGLLGARSLGVRTVIYHFVAEPGAGKTTRVPPAILAAGLAGDVATTWGTPATLAVATLMMALAACAYRPPGT